MKIISLHNFTLTDRAFYVPEGPGKIKYSIIFQCVAPVGQNMHIIFWDLFYVI